MAMPLTKITKRQSQFALDKTSKKRAASPTDEPGDKVVARIDLGGGREMHAMGF